MSWLVDIAEAINTALNAYGSFSQSFTAERSYADWAIELENLDTLQVDVVPAPQISGEVDSRASATISVTVDIGVRKRFGAVDQDGTTGRIDPASIDELVELVQEIWLWLIEKHYRLTAAQTAVWQESKIVSAFSRRDLRKNRQFTSIIRSTYQIEQALSLS